MKGFIQTFMAFLIVPYLISTSYADIQEPLPPRDEDQNQCVEPDDQQRGQLFNLHISGVEDITTAIMQSTPSTLQGQVFDIEIRGREEYSLTLFPESAFTITDYYANFFKAEVTNAAALYVTEGGIYFPRYEKIKYRISLANALPIPQCTDSFQKCLISVSFLYNRQLLDFERISEAFDYKFIFNEEALELIKVSGSDVQFRRKNNDYATVKLEMVSRSTNRVIKIESEPLALCKQMGSDSGDHDGDNGDGHGDGHGDGSGHGGGHGDGNGHGGGHHDGDDNDDDHGPRPPRTPVREIDHNWMRFKSTQVDILNRDDRLGRGFTAYYRVIVANPYPFDIECDVTLVSSRGVNREYEIIDTKVHKNFYIEAKSSADEDGQIEGKSGHGTNGLLWTTNYGHEVKATGCRAKN